MSDEAQLYAAHEQRIRAVEGAVEKIAASMEQLVRLEERHAETRQGLDRAFLAIERRKEEHDALNTRVAAIEVVMPGLKETRKWIVSAVLGIISLNGLAMLALIGLGKH